MRIANSRFLFKLIFWLAIASAGFVTNIYAAEPINGQTVNTFSTQDHAVDALKKLREKYRTFYGHSELKPVSHTTAPSGKMPASGVVNSFCIGGGNGQ